MNKILLAVIMIGAFALSACTRPDRFGAGANGAVDPNGGLNNGINQSGLGGPNDPTSAAYFNQTVGDRVLFLVDTWTLTPEGTAKLNGQARWLAANGDYLAIIEGHADERGTSAYNYSLGSQRAEAVRNYLISQGISSSRLRVISYGKDDPLAICSDETCYAQNRRAVTVISVGTPG